MNNISVHSLEDKKFSIIIPHKNSVDTLIRLIESIPARKDIEIIIVDDCSEEMVRDDLKAYTVDKNRIIALYPNSSLGAGGARNLGLDKAVGKWIIFADADDFFSNNFNEILDKYILAQEDIIYFGTFSVYNDNGEEGNRHLRYQKLVNDYLQHKKNGDRLKYQFTAPWGKMIKKDLIKLNNIRFEEILAGNDINFSLKVAYAARNIAATAEVVYIITMGYGSLINTSSRKHFEARFHATLRGNKFLKTIKKSKYQMSVLYFLYSAYQYGFWNVLLVFGEIIKNRSNLFIGLDKVFNLRKVIEDRGGDRKFKKEVN